jgi:protein TonB
MSVAHLANPPVRPADRLTLTLFLAVAVHATLILGLGFAPELRSPLETPPTLEITVVRTRTEKAPEKADFLAQSAQEGGGQLEEKARPTTPTPRPERAPAVQTAPPPVESQPKPPQPAEQPTLTQNTAEVEVPKPEPRTEPKPPPPQAAEIISRGLEIASLSADLDRSLRAYAKRPRRKFINASTQEYKYAAYLQNWVAKVERIGNLNYPDEARRNRLSGSLLLDVALKPDGTIHSVVLRHSSGHKVLDDAAMRIVRLAAPFAPFPPNIRSETDLLHITRTWQFLSEKGLFSR